MKDHRFVQLASIVLCSFLLFSFAVSAFEVHHDCTGKTCHFCLAMQQCKTLCRSMAEAMVFSAISPFLLHILVRFLQYVSSEIQHQTPVVMKVRILN